MGRTLLFLVVSFCVCAQASVQIQNQGNRKIYRFQLENVRHERVSIADSEYLQTSLVGAGGYEAIRHEVGAPEIPVIRFFVEGEGEIEVKVGLARSANSMIKNWKPVLPSVEKLPGRSLSVVINPEIRKRTTLLPAVDYEVETVGTVRGVLRRMVTLHPVKIVPATGRQELISEFEVSTPNVTLEAIPKVMAFVVGKKFVGAEALSRYHQHKVAQGFQVKWIHAENDTAEMIRAKLRAAYQESGSLGYVLLIGDNADVPGYKSKLLSGVTDHFFSSLDKPAYDGDIGTPDVSVGRLSVSSLQDLEVVIDKHLKYEGRGDLNWRKYQMFIGTDDSSFYKIAEGTLNYAIETYTSKLGYLGNFPAEVNQGGDKLFAIKYKASGADTVKRLKEGRTFIDYSGHGWIDYWDAPRVVASDVRALSTDALPTILSHACLTGKFTDDSFAETWQRHRYGSIYFLGSMDSSYWDEDDIMTRKTYDVMYKEGKLEFSQMVDLSLAEVWRHYGGKGKSAYYWETYINFGDTSMSFRR